MSPCRPLVAFAAGTALAALPPLALGAQRAAPLSPTTFVVEAGAGTSAAGAFARGCGIEPAVTLGATLLRRVARVVVIEGSVGMTNEVPLSTCSTDALGPIDHIPPTFIPLGVVAERDPSEHAFATTIVRAGLETPRDWTDGTVFRVTGGAGRMWGVSVPFRTLRVTSLIGRGRVLSSLSFERWWYGLPVTGFDPALVTPGQFDGVLRVNTVRHLRARSSSVRLGVEWALGGR